MRNYRPWLITISVIALIFIASIAIAQDAPLPAEPDTESFLETHFVLQASYNRVLCASTDATCPSEITAAVPCLTSTCNHAEQTYPVTGSYTTIQEAHDAAQPGDLIIITPGRYRGVQVEETGGEEGAYIHLLGWGDPGSVIVDAPARPDVSYLRHHFYFIAAHHYIIQNIAFEGAGDGAGVFFSGYFAGTGQFGHHLIVTDIYSHDNGVWGLHTTSASYILIQDSVFTNSGEEHGAYISGSGDDMVIRRNVFQGNTLSGLQINADPQTATAEIFYWLQESTGDTCGWTEDDVDFTGSAQWEDLKACYDGQGLPDLGAYIEDGISERLIVEQNIMTGNGVGGAAGINLASVRNSTMRNNLIYGNGAAGITCWDNAYAEDKGLPGSIFGCENVMIVNNTVVDETGNRGAIIISNDARDMTIFNNIIVRDRFDAYEIIDRAGQGLRSGSNYYYSLNLDNAPGIAQIDTDATSGSITDFSIPEALANFAAPGFAPWMITSGTWPSLNPDRPDFHPNPASPLASVGNPVFAPTLDLNGSPRTGTVIGALVTAGAETAGGEPVAQAQPTAVLPTPAPQEGSSLLDAVSAAGDAAAGGAGDDASTSDVPPDVPTTGDEGEAAAAPAPAATGGTITFQLPEGGGLFRIAAQPGAQAQDLRPALDALAPGGGDEWVNISPDGEWIILSSERFDAQCVGWPCLAIATPDLSSGEAITTSAGPVHSQGLSAVATVRDLLAFPLVVYPESGGPHELDLWMTRRDSSVWSEPLLLTADSPYEWHSQPALSPDGARAVFDCGNEPYAAAGTAICEVNTDGTGFRVVIRPEDHPNGSGALHAPDYAPDGSIVFEAEWSGGEQIWRLPVGAAEAVLQGEAFTNDNSPCVLPDGRIVSLWLNRPENAAGLHELKVMAPDGGSFAMLVSGIDILDAGLGCAP